MASRLGPGWVALAIACGGCEGGSLVHHEALAEVHQYGVTSCPQDLGELEVQLSEHAAEPVLLSVREDMFAIDVLDPDLGWPINEGFAISIAPGEALVFPVQFNCGSTEDIAGSIVLETFSRSGGGSEPIESAAIPVVLDIQGGP